MKPFTQSKVVVLGSGRAGISMARFLLSQGADVAISERADLRLTDRQLQQLEHQGVEFESGGHTEKFVTNCDLVAVSPGIPLDAPIIAAVKEKKIPLTGELGLFAAVNRFRVAAVTGSNGKTTVTSLLGHLLKCEYEEVFVGGNIGTPLLDSLSGERTYSWSVLELSSFQLEMVDTFRPDIALVLNISPDHLDRHHTMDAYVRAKLNIIKNQSSEDLVLLGTDDPVLSTDELDTKSRIYSFGTEASSHACIEGHQIRLRFGKTGETDEHYDLGSTKLTSHVNCLNSAAAILAARLAGCSKKNIERGLAGFQLPRHRMSFVGTIEGVEYINDSKATNIGAMLAALKGFSKPVVLIAGGRNKGGDFSLLRQAMKENVSHLVVIGEAAEAMEQAFSGIVDIRHADSMESAVAKARQCSNPGDTVLLAPGCASFDMFDSYEQRGELFTKAVSDLIEKRK